MGEEEEAIFVSDLYVYGITRAVVRVCWSSPVEELLGAGIPPDCVI